MQGLGEMVFGKKVNLYRKKKINLLYFNSLKTKPKLKYSLQQNCIRRKPNPHQTQIYN